MASPASPTSGVAQRYATALFDLADEKQAHDAVAESLNGLIEATKQSADFASFLNDKKLSMQARVSAASAVADQMNLHPFVKNTVGLMAHNGRLDALPGVAKAYIEELAKRRGEITAEVTVAEALTDEQWARLEGEIRKAHGAKVNMTVFIDPSLIGGLIVKVGSKLVDASLKSKLLKMQLAMKGAA